MNAPKRKVPFWLAGVLFALALPYWCGRAFFGGIVRGRKRARQRALEARLAGAPVLPKTK